MRRFTMTLALLVTAAAAAGAQQMDHGKMMDMHKGMAGMPGMAGMKTTCPLYLTTLSLTPAQQVIVDSLRKEHEGLMKDTKDQAAMENTMKTTFAAMRVILTPPQRTVFDAAVTAHEAEMKAMMAKMPMTPKKAPKL